jgi:uncharacterized protein (DUF983 family)
MRMYRCPHCGENTINIIHKACMNINYPFKCKNCGMKYGPPYIYSALVLTIICIIFVFAYISTISFIAKVSIAIFLAALYHLVHISVIPIAKK